jgi:hypothetical protein
LLFPGRFLRRTQGFASSFGRLGQRKSTLHVVQDRGLPLEQSDAALQAERVDFEISALCSPKSVHS